MEGEQIQVGQIRIHTGRVFLRLGLFEEVKMIQGKVGGRELLK